MRLRKNLTQAELAEQVGVSHVYISALERGAKPAPRLEIVTSLARCLGVDEDELWVSAQSEREERLRSRIQGQPTSRKSPKSQPPSSRSGFFNISAEIARLARSLDQSDVSENERQLLLAELQLLQKKLADKEATQ
ncbi:helix-turn-helix domain-containing protein [Candidatus Bipolaricaulota bacterium]|nr:helix-turn-helix domain-containing protein [Candidatus Bipolaricaulota bacterium]